MCVAARTRSGFAGLLTVLDKELPLGPVSRATVRIPASEGALIHLLHERAKVLKSRYEGDFCEMEAEVPESVRRKLAPYAVQ